MREIIAPAYEFSGDIYIPIEELQDTYDIEVENNEKIIITTSDSNYTKIETAKKGKIIIHPIFLKE